jgi:hypothetical protein
MAFISLVFFCFFFFFLLSISRRLAHDHSLAYPISLFRSIDWSSTRVFVCVCVHKQTNKCFYCLCAANINCFLSFELTPIEQAAFEEIVFFQICRLMDSLLTVIVSALSFSLIHFASIIFRYYFNWINTIKTPPNPPLTFFF